MPGWVGGLMMALLSLGAVFSVIRWWAASRGEPGERRDRSCGVHSTNVIMTLGAALMLAAGEGLVPRPVGWLGAVGILLAVAGIGRVPSFVRRRLRGIPPRR